MERSGWLVLTASAGSLILVFLWKRSRERRHRVPCESWARWVMAKTDGSSLQAPLLLTGVPLGECTDRWSDTYLERIIGETKISVHISNTRFLDFAAKNFKYEIMTFQGFLRRIQSSSEGTFLYYRSQHQKRNKASSLDTLGSIADDFVMPRLLLDPFRVHSTVLRVASTGLCMWLHYDVCDNFLCCIRGRKRVVLFHPNDIDRLYVSGSSSAMGSRLLQKRGQTQLWKEFPLASAAWSRRLEVVLNAGDVLFIPSFWPHCTEALPSKGSRSSISVNTFLQRPEWASLHDPKDVWANRELLPAQEATKGMEKILPQLQELPPVPRAFYCRKMAAELLAMAN
ncbi:tRNA wybutosine-synthesizing protein 5 [Symbiodinium microadriaticum]|uniref:tRNA wybutosine-synthesizing protein 5 n=1 Tax=Symbiodinium microadriaticum TaxID=2951 RepID=A0A1Q9D7F6_SYMMI|nr:tRNA wybutosine-synthesizing protein 5 [Symbiodinium microadriaticum]